MEVNNKGTHYEVILAESEYELFKGLEGLLATECYDKFGMKREESVEMAIKLNNTLELHLAQSVPYHEDLTTLAYAALHDTKEDLWIDCPEPDDTILGEYHFFVDDDITIIVKVQE